MFAATMQGGMSMAVPDVCNVPAPPAPPIPTPFPNQAMLQTANGSTCAQKVYISNMKAFTQKTEIPMSSGDEAGTLGGIVSGMIKGPVKFTTGSVKVTIEGSPAIKLTAPTTQNGSSPNTTGVHMQPSQQKVMIMQ
jgi:hypothetical protein